MANSDPALVAAVCSILASSGCQKINYAYNGVSVNSGKFGLVTNAITANPSRISVIYGATGQDAGAIFDPSTNTLAIKQTANISDVVMFSMTVVHECTHAITFQGGNVMQHLNTEAIAYLAGGLYLYYSEIDDYSNYFVSALLTAAYKAAVQFVALSPAITVPENIMTPIKEAIKNDPAYDWGRWSLPSYGRGWN